MRQKVFRMVLFLPAAVAFAWKVSLRRNVFAIVPKDRPFDAALTAARLHSLHVSPLWEELCSPRGHTYRRVVLMPAEAAGPDPKLQDLWREAEKRGWQKPTPADMADFAEQYPNEQHRGDIVWFFDCRSAGVLCGAGSSRALYDREAHRRYPETARAAFIIPD